MRRIINTPHHSLRSAARTSWMFALLAVVSTTLPFGTRSAVGFAQDWDQFNRFAQASNSSSAAKKLFREARELIDKEDWAKAAERYNDFIATHPKDKSVDAALYWQAYALKKQEKLREAEQKLDRLIREFPRSSWVNDARAMRIEIAPLLGDIKIPLAVLRENLKENIKENIKNNIRENIENIGVVVSPVPAININVPPVNVTLPSIDIDLFPGIPPAPQRPGASAGNDAEELKLIALQSLFQATPERGMAIVMDLLKPSSTASPRLKQTAVMLLGQHGGKSAIPVLIDIARNSSGDAKLRRTAIHYLGRTDDDRALDILKEIAVATPDDSSTNESRRAPAPASMISFGWRDSNSIARTALQAIAQHRSERARSILSELARTARSRSVRRDAILQLGQQKGEAAIDELMTIYAADQDAEIRKQILLALSQIGSPRAQERLLEVARTDSNVELRKQAVTWLGQRGGPQAINALIGLYDSEKSDEIKGRLLSAFSRSKERAALNKLMDVARRDASIELRKRAVLYLGQSKDPEAAKFLEDILK